ncbi:MAG: hypothetical protein WC796_01460 [Candidatus Pacearchaeota archaeon]|jgi:hypothetical protein
MEELTEKKINIELLRLAIIALLVASMFGVLQYFQNNTIDALGVDALLKVVAIVLFKAPFLLFITYVIVLGLSLRYENKNSFPKVQAYLYDLGIFLTSFLILFVIILALLAWLFGQIPKFPWWVAALIVWGIVLAVVILTNYPLIKKYFKKKLKANVSKVCEGKKHDEEMLKVAKRTLSFSRLSFGMTIVSTLILGFIAVLSIVILFPAQPNIRILGSIEGVNSGDNLLKECEIFSCSFNYNKDFRPYSLNKNDNYTVFDITVVNEGKSTSNIGALFKCNFEVAGAALIVSSRQAINASIQWRGNTLPSALSINNQKINDLVDIRLFGYVPSNNPLCHFIYSSEDKGKDEFDITFKKI